MAPRRRGMFVLALLAAASVMATPTLSTPEELVADPATTASTEATTILLELAEIDRMIALQEQKLARLRDLRRLSMGGMIQSSAVETDTAATFHQQVESLLAQSTPSASAPSTCSAQPLTASGTASRPHSDGAFHRWFVERHAQDLSVAALHVFRLPHPRLFLPLSLLFVATSNGTLNFYELPAGTLVKSLQVPQPPSAQSPKARVVSATFALVPTPHVTLMHASGSRVMQKVNVTFDWASATPSSDLPEISLVEATSTPPTTPFTLSAPHSALLAAHSTTFHNQELHFLHVGHRDGRDPSPNSSSAADNSDGAPAPTKHAVHIVDDKGVLLHTLSALDAAVPVRAMAPHRHLLAVTQDTSVFLFPLSRLGEQVHYVCEGSRSPIVALAFDPASPSIMYATVASGDVLVFNLYVDRTRTCRLLHRLPPSGGGPSVVHDSAILTLPGHILVTSRSTLALWNVTDVATHRPRYVTGVINSNREADKALRTVALPRHPIRVAVLPRLDLDDHDTAGGRDVAVVGNVGSGHSTVVVLESFLPAQPPAGSLALGGMDLSWFRLPLLALVAVIVVVYKMSTKASAPSTAAPDGAPASMEELERMLGRARKGSLDGSSGGARGGRDPTFDPSPLSYADRTSQFNRPPSFDRPRPSTAASRSAYRPNNMADSTASHQFHDDFTTGI